MENLPMGKNRHAAFCFVVPSAVSIGSRNTRAAQNKHTSDKNKASPRLKDGNFKVIHTRYSNSCRTALSSTLQVLSLIPGKEYAEN